MKDFERYLKILKYLLCGLSKKEIAQKMKISEATLYRTLNEEEFKKLRQNLLTHSFEELKLLFVESQREALSYLMSILKNKRKNEVQKYFCIHTLTIPTYTLTHIETNTKQNSRKEK